MQYVQRITIFNMPVLVPVYKVALRMSKYAQNHMEKDEI